jgi:Tfp pilus assembly protein PilF
LLAHKGPTEATPILAAQQAIREAPASAYRWADLGDAFQNAQQADKADYAFHQALLAGPRNPVILLRSGNFYFSAGGYSKALECFSAILRDPELRSYYPSVYLTYDRMPVSLNDIAKSGIPRQQLEEYQAWRNRQPAAAPRHSY